MKINLKASLPASSLFGMALGLLFCAGAAHVQAAPDDKQPVTIVKPSGIKPSVFKVVNPNYEKSPYTGMTRKHWIQAAEYLLGGAFSYIHTLDDPMYFPKQLDKTYPRSEGQVGVAKLEGLCRTLFVAAPLLRENPDLTLNGIKVADYYRHQLINMTREGSSSFVPHRTGGPSQTMLELGAMCISLKVAHQVLWDTLTQEQRDALAALVKSYGEGPTIDSNWRFFNVFIMSFLKDQGYETKDDYLKMNLDKLLSRYRGEGWYNDSPAYDYYSMWAFQTYGPLWAELFGKKQFPQEAAAFMKNQHDLVNNYPYMFSRDGRMNMWGRSIPYRFAAVSPFALLEYDHAGEVNFGWMRRISSATLLQFLERPDFLQDGIPTMGFYGPFAPAVQIYSCRGSVYWCGKAFFNLLLPEDSRYWSAKENNGPWENELKPGHVYNKFQPGTNLMITDYPDCGGAEMRSWCHETVAKDWQKFRSSENYNKLAYHTEFPWMADGPDGEISMNYGTLNKKGQWEVLRLYTFKSFKNGVYRRDAVLETDTAVKYQLADIPLPGGVLRVDKVTVPDSTRIRLGHYALPVYDDIVSDITEGTDGKQYTQQGILSNGRYSLAMIPLAGWEADAIEEIRCKGLHPETDECALLRTKDTVSGSKIYVTLELWKKGKEGFTQEELSPVRSVKVAADKKSVTVSFADGSKKTVSFN